MSQSGTIGLGGGAGSGDVLFLQGNSGGSIGPNGGGTIFIVGSGPYAIAGNAGTNTLTLSDNGTVGRTITGNSGGALSPTAGNWNIITANSTPKFVGAVSTETLDFGLTNLVLGSSMASVTTGVRNVGLGLGVLNAVTSASDSTAVGYHALNILTSSGNNNTAIGSGSMALATTASLCTAVGSGTLAHITASGGSNCAFGTFALGTTALSESNCAYGVNALNALGASIGFNSAFGDSSGLALVTGSYNTLLGFSSGSTYVGAEDSNVIIRNVGVAGDSNTIRIGTQGAISGLQNRCFVAGIYGVTPTVPAPQVVVIDSSGQLGSQPNVASEFWNEVTAASANMLVENGYVSSNAGAVTLTLPNTAVFGSSVSVAGKGAGGWIIAQNAGEQIIWDAVTATTVGVGGSLASTDRYDTVELLCIVASTTWVVLTAKGNITVT